MEENDIFREINELKMRIIELNSIQDLSLQGGQQTVIRSDWQRKALKKKPLILNQEEHKVFLIDDETVEMEKATDMLHRDFVLSRMDSEDFLIYKTLANSIKEWWHMGYKVIAEDAKLEVRVSANMKRNESGFERIMQGTEPSTSIEINKKGIRTNPIPQEESAGGGGGLKRLFGRAKSE